jgi:hypothetical protein
MEEEEEINIIEGKLGSQVYLGKKKEKLILDFDCNYDYFLTF